MSDGPREEAVEIACGDGFALAGTAYFPQSTPRGALLINPATGVRKEFYSKFARGCAERGLITLAYDYRGIGGSRPASLKGFSARMQDWGRIDMPAALEKLASLAPGLPIGVLGHSVGGQLLGLMHNHPRVKAAVTVAASTGTWWQMGHWGYRLFCASLWYGFVPFFTTVLGYAPAKALKQGEDLPKGVAQEWARWCRSGDYFGVLLRGDAPVFFEQFAAPLLALWFSDDPIANESTVPALHKFYPRASIESRRIEPSEARVKSLGHFAFFSSGHRQTLWPIALDWLEQKLFA
jgi:predicted alpha/beta hydrolase